ncbi:hypothetical protein [Pelagicoccus sp. SDUM812003]|uniref:hypothetical protein n=1 Tax=Pelagicoccus sp. SDUM812003 TaxID=3041267 RepID=UPI00280E48CB|nr:hypothetical protein [Pelagicoccus sp. SDUM812003]MDQ8201971.1 hypothetical protein [Pelagicoccus sp. SDUM812003]
MSEVSIKELDSRMRKQFDVAQLAVERGNYEYAVEICSSLLLEKPAFLEARQLLRQAQQCIYANQRKRIPKRIQNSIAAFLCLVYGKPYLKKNPSMAMAYGERALNRNPFHKGGLSLVAEGAEALELYRTAVFCLDGICDRDSEDIELLKRYCEALTKVGETKKAVEVAERLSRLKPESGAIQELVKSASVAHSINQGKWAEKERDFRSKLRDEEQADSLERESRLRQDEGAALAHERELEDAIQRDPQNLDLYKRLVKTLVKGDDFENALHWLDKAALLPQAESDLALKQTRSEIAIKATERELQKLQTDNVNRPEKRKRNQKRIRILESELETLRLEETRKMVEQFPNDYAQRLKYGELLLRMDRYDEAIKQFQVSQRSTSLRQRSSVLLGRAFFKKSLFDIALQQFDQAIEGSLSMDEFKKDVLYSSAECCERLGRREEAIRRYKIIYASDIGFRDVAEKIDQFYSDSGS